MDLLIQYILTLQHPCCILCLATCREWLYWTQLKKHWRALRTHILLILMSKYLRFYGIFFTLFFMELETYIHLKRAARCPGACSSCLRRVRGRDRPFWVLCTQSSPAFLQEIVSSIFKILNLLKFFVHCFLSCCVWFQCITLCCISYVEKSNTLKLADCFIWLVPWDPAK
jgi:hypothetical protein